MGANGASLTLVRHGRLVTAAGTGDTIVELDQSQYDSAQGPCVDASTHGQRFYIESAEDEQRWSSFIPGLIEHGFHSVLSTPLVTATGPVGALNLYARPTDAFDSDGQALASVFAAQARRSSATARWSIPPSSSRHACKPHSKTELSSRKPKGC